MSVVGSPTNTSLIQTAQAQQVAGKARDRERVASERDRRLQDRVELRVAGIEEIDAPRELPGNESEQAGEEHRRTPGPAKREDRERPHIDVQA